MPKSKTQPCDDGGRTPGKVPGFGGVVRAEGAGGVGFRDLAGLSNEGFQGLRFEGFIGVSGGGFRGIE